MNWIETQPLLSACLVVILAIVPFAPSVSNEFLNWDDNEYITENAAVKWMSWAAVGEMLTKPYYTDYSPVFLLSLGLEHRLTGGGARGFRVVGLGLHALNALLVWQLLRRLAGSGAGGLLGAAIFAAHPVQVESVAWVTEQKNLLSLLFMLLALLAYVRWTEERRASGAWYAAALVASTLACLAKPSTVVLPLLLALYEICFCATAPRKILLRSAPFLMIAVTAAVLAVSAQRRANAIAPWHGGTVQSHLLSIVPLAAGYLRTFVMPNDLCALRENVVQTSVLRVPALVGLAVLIAWGALCWHYWRRERRVAFWLLWVPVTLLPVANLIAMRNMMAERYLYLPAVGFGALAGMAFSGGLRRWGPHIARALSAVAAAALVLLAMLCWARSPVWRDSLSLWRASVARAPNVLTARLNLGFTHMDRGHLAQGLELIERAPRRTADDQARWHQAMGDLALRLDRPEALELLTKAKEIRPTEARTWYLLSVAYMRSGQTGEAERALREALRLRPSLSEARNNLATLLMNSGRYPEAEEEYRRAIRSEFLPYTTYYNLATLYVRTGRVERARQCYEQVLRLAPPHFDRRATARKYIEDRRGPPSR